MELGKRELIMKDGPFAREMQKPQLMLVKHVDYGLEKLRKRNQHAKYLQSKNNQSRK